MSKLTSILSLIVLSVTAAMAMLTIQPPPLTPWAPAGFTETPTPLPSDTPEPTATSTATLMPTPTSTDVPTAIPTNTPILTSPPAETSPTPTQTSELHNTLPPPTATLLPVLSDPYIIKQVNLEQAQVGDVVVFTIEIVNPNPVAIDDVVVGDALSPLVDYLSSDVPRGVFTFDPSANAWTWAVRTMGPNERVTVAIATRVSERARPPNTLANTAVLTSSQGMTQSNTTNTLIVPKRLPDTGRR